MPDPVESIKKAALDAMNASKPVDIVFGQVTNGSPLEITIEQKIVLTAPMLILTRNVKDFDVDVTVNWRTVSAAPKKHKHKVTSASTDPGGDPTHSHSVPEFETEEEEDPLSHSHGISGRKTMTVHNALCTGEYVMMLRMIGGQQYVVVDRVI